MPRNFSKYQYETSPRKLEPEYTPKKSPYKTKKSTAKKNKINKLEKQNQLKRQKRKAIKYVILAFIILFGISYRNSQIDESFSKVQDLKQELAEVEKQNAQLEINIENGLNLNNLENEAKTLLGMQKLTNKQTVYVSLPKTDYIKGATEEVKIEDNINILDKIINGITNMFK